MKVWDIMTDSIVSVGQQEPVSAAARLMKRHNLGALPVCDDSGHLLGIVTDRDIVTRCVAVDLPAGSTQTGEVMSRGVNTCAAGDDVDAAAQTMRQQQVRRLPVMDGGRLVGMVSLCDLARRDTCSMEAAEALGDISANIRRW
ncbi:MAG: CBS domain-containing protein [Oscillospiraceae bacterium]|nr:CBS domain-containing protein [Oscillospiraceae bacterium]